MATTKILRAKTARLNRIYITFGMACAITCSACAPEKRTYEFAGKRVTCTFEVRDACGVNLWGCEDDRKYYCLTDVSKLDD